MLLKRLLILLVILCPLCAYADSEEIRLVIRADNYIPYKWIDENRNPRGIYVDIVREAARIAGVQVVISAYPWVRCLDMVKNGKADGIIGVFKTAERESYLHFVNEPLAYEEVTFFSHSTNPIEFEGDIEQLHIYSIGYIRGSSFGDIWEKHKDKFRKQSPVRSQELLIRTLSAKRVELIIGNRMITEHFSRTIGLSDQLRPLHPSISLDAGYLAFSKTADPERGMELAHRFNQAILYLKTSETYSDILDRYADF